VKASKAKTASRRLVPITENLRRWLEIRKQAEGNVREYANVTKRLRWLAQYAQFSCRTGRRFNICRQDCHLGMN
jgi:hypothetical protein